MISGHCSPAGLRHFPVFSYLVCHPVSPDGRCSCCTPQRKAPLFTSVCTVPCPLVHVRRVSTACVHVLQACGTCCGALGLAWWSASLMQHVGAHCAGGPSPTLRVKGHQHSGPPHACGKAEEPLVLPGWPCLWPAGSCTTPVMLPDMLPGRRRSAARSHPAASEATQFEQHCLFMMNWQCGT